MKHIEFSQGEFSHYSVILVSIFIIKSISLNYVVRKGGTFRVLE